MFLFALFLALPLPANPDRRAGAERHRALIWERMPVERWFIPGELGHEAGKTAPPVREGAFLLRSIYSLDAGITGEWARRNQLSEWRGMLHNLEEIFPPELFDAHPEYFPLIDGERWRPLPGMRPPNWNPDLGEAAVVAHAAEYAREYFRTNPHDFWVRLGTNDGLTYGESEAILRWVYPPRWFRKRPDYSNLVFQFTTAVAEEVAPDWYGKHFGQLAYYWSESPPSFLLHPQVFPFLSTDQSQLYDPAFRQEEYALREAWGEQGLLRLGMGSYLYGDGFLIPRQHLPYIAESLRHARAVGFTDFHALAGFNWGLDGPQPWVVTRLLLDPSQPIEPLLEEYYRRYFRAAAVPMRRFFEACERIWREQPGPAYWLKHFRNESQADLFPTVVNRQLRRILKEAEGLVLGDDVAYERVQLTRAAFSVVEAFAQFHEVRQALSDALMAGMEISDPQRLQELLDAYREARDGPSGFVQVIRDVQTANPLAMSRFNPLVYLLNDPGPTAAALLDQSVGDWAAAYPSSPDLSWDLESAFSGGIEVAGLLYRLDTPEGWGGRVEPWEGYFVDWREKPGGAVLRMENQKRLELWHLSRAFQGLPGLARIELRGHLSPSAFVLLRASWFDGGQNHVGEETAVRLHDGDHPDWKVLRLLLDPPEGAVYLRYWVTTFHMMPGDWIEARNPEVVWYF